MDDFDAVTEATKQASDELQTLREALGGQQNKNLKVDQQR